jgi:hypothetical protein
MDTLSLYLELYSRDTKPEDAPKHAVLNIFREILLAKDITTRIEKMVEDKSALDEFLKKCGTGGGQKLLKDIATFNGNLANKAKQMTQALNKAKKKEKERLERAKQREEKAEAKNEIKEAPVGGADAKEVPKPPKPPKKAEAKNEIKEAPVGGADAKEVPKPPKPPKKTKDKISKEMREQIWETYIGDHAISACPVCHKRYIRMTDFSAGHIVAEACGGETNVRNLMPICGTCNSRMATKNLFEYCRKEFDRDPVVSNVIEHEPAAKTKAKAKVKPPSD